MKLLTTLMVLSLLATAGAWGDDGGDDEDRGYIWDFDSFSMNPLYPLSWNEKKPNFLDEWFDLIKNTARQIRLKEMGVPIFSSAPDDSFKLIEHCFTPALMIGENLSYSENNVTGGWGMIAEGDLIDNETCGEDWSDPKFTFIGGNWTATLCSGENCTVFDAETIEITRR